MKNNLVSIQIKKMVEKNDNVIVIFINRDSLISDIGIDEYKRKLTSSFLVFIEKEDLKSFKTFNIDTDKYTNDIEDFLYGINIFPLAIVFKKTIAKYVIPIEI